MKVITSILAVILIVLLEQWSGPYAWYCEDRVLLFLDNYWPEYWHSGGGIVQVSRSGSVKRVEFWFRQFPLLIS